jgi:hypothetical protein
MSSLPLDAYTEASIRFWSEDLHTVVHCSRVDFWGNMYELIPGSPGMGFGNCWSWNRWLGARIKSGQGTLKESPFVILQDNGLFFEQRRPIMSKRTPITSIPKRHGEGPQIIS